MSNEDSGNDKSAAALFTALVSFGVALPSILMLSIGMDMNRYNRAFEKAGSQHYETVQDSSKTDSLGIYQKGRTGIYQKDSSNHAYQ